MTDIPAFNEGELLGADHLNQLVYALNPLQAQLELLKRDGNRPTLIGQVQSVQDGLASTQYPYLKVLLYDINLENTNKQKPDNVNADFPDFKGYPTQGQFSITVPAFPSLQTYERLIVPDSGTGDVDRTSSNWWMYKLSELYVTGNRVRLYELGGFYFFDCEEYPWIPARIDENLDGGKYRLTAQSIDDSGSLSDGGSLWAWELSSNAYIDVDATESLRPIVWVKLDRRRNFFTYAAPSPVFLCLLSANASLATNRWTYDGDECDAEGNLILGGRSVEDALNGFELINSGSGMQGNGVNVDNLPVGFSIQPIQVGDVVMMFESILADGSKKYMFSDPNGVDGECPEGEE